MHSIHKNNLTSDAFVSWLVMIVDEGCGRADRYTIPRYFIGEQTIGAKIHACFLSDVPIRCRFNRASDNASSGGVICKEPCGACRLAGKGTVICKIIQWTESDAKIVNKIFPSKLGLLKHASI